MLPIKYRATRQILLDGQAAGELACDPNGNLRTVGDEIAIIPITFALNTLVYTAGNVLAIPTVVSNVFTEPNGLGTLESIVLNDKDDLGVALYVVVMDANVSLGTINTPVSITDANADSILGIIPVETADWIDLGGCRVATIRNIKLPIKSVSGLTTLYLGLITRGTPLHTAAGITARIGISRN